MDARMPNDSQKLTNSQILLDNSLFRKYFPRIMINDAEPFPLVAIGCTRFNASAKSPSSRWNIVLDPERTSFVLEYAFYWDWDIQHLYDLEHVWIHVGPDGRTTDCEASFHGKFLRMLLPDRSNLSGETTVTLYCQAGKHAFMPKPELFELLPRNERVTREEAGIDGLSMPDLFAEKWTKSPEIDARVAQSLKAQAFTPAQTWHPLEADEAMFMPWDALRDWIPQRISACVNTIGPL